MPCCEVLSGGPAAGALLRVHGAKSIFKLAAADHRVLATFGSDGSPALLRREVGSGSATYAAFLPGLSYFAPAVPRRPVDRAATDAGFNHFVPTEFAEGARQLLAAPLAGVAGAVPVEASEPLVEAGVVTAANASWARPSCWSTGRTGRWRGCSSRSTSSRCTPTPTSPRAASSASPRWRTAACASPSARSTSATPSCCAAEPELASSALTALRAALT